MDIKVSYGLWADLPKNRVILDWGLGELNPKKKGIGVKDTLESEYENNDFDRLDHNNKYFNQPKYRS